MHSSVFHITKAGETYMKSTNWGSRIYRNFVSTFSGEDYSPDPYNWDFIGKNLFCMGVEGFVYFIINILFQYCFFLNNWQVNVLPNLLDAHE